MKYNPYNNRTVSVTYLINGGVRLFIEPLHAGSTLCPCAFCAFPMLKRGSAMSGAFLVELVYSGCLVGVTLGFA